MNLSMRKLSMLLLVLIATIGNVAPVDAKTNSALMDETFGVVYNTTGGVFTKAGDIKCLEFDGDCFTFVLCWVNGAQSEIKATMDDRGCWTFELNGQVVATGKNAGEAITFTLTDGMTTGVILFP